MSDYEQTLPFEMVEMHFFALYGKDYLRKMAEAAGVSTKTVYNWRRRGIPAEKRGAFDALKTVQMPYDKYIISVNEHGKFITRTHTTPFIARIVMTDEHSEVIGGQGVFDDSSVHRCASVKGIALAWPTFFDFKVDVKGRFWILDDALIHISKVDGYV